MKKKVLLFVSILMLVFMVGVTTAFATSYTSTINFSRSLTGADRTYQGGSDMGINCSNTTVNVDPYCYLVSTPTTFNVTLYQGAQPGGTSMGTVTGFPMSTSTTYNGKWIGDGPGSSSLIYYYKFAAINTREYNTQTGTYSYATIHGNTQMYSE